MKQIKIFNRSIDFELEKDFKEWALDFPYIKIVDIKMVENPLNPFVLKVFVIFEV